MKGMQSFLPSFHIGETELSKVECFLSLMVSEPQMATCLLGG